MDFSIPRNCPSIIEEQLKQLITDLKEGFITEKGYNRLRERLLDTLNTNSADSHVNNTNSPQLSNNSYPQDDHHQQQQGSNNINNPRPLSNHSSSKSDVSRNLNLDFYSDISPNHSNNISNFHYPNTNINKLHSQLGHAHGHSYSHSNSGSITNTTTDNLSSNDGYVPGSSNGGGSNGGTGFNNGNGNFYTGNFHEESTEYSESGRDSAPYNYYDYDYEENDNNGYYNSNGNGNHLHSSNAHKELQKPLDPRDISEVSNKDVFENLPSILRHRGTTYAKELAIMIVDGRGKEVQTITWDKLYLKAEKVAQQIKNKAALYPGDRVTLLYQNIEVIEFIVSLFGCFLSGTVAVPINSNLPTREIVKIMTDTQSHLCLMSESVYKHFDKLNNINNNSSSSKNHSVWPKGMDIWKTTDMGTYQPPKKTGPPAIKITDLAYIEHTKSSIGELRGVVLSHRTLMHQMNSLKSILKSKPGFDPKNSFVRSELKHSTLKQMLLSTLDVRESIGLIVGVLFTVYTGNTLIWTPQRCTEIPGLYAHLISKYRASIILSDYLSLKQVTYNYQSFPQLTRTYNKKVKVDLSCVKWCLINTFTIDCEFNDMLTDRWFRPLGNSNAKNIIAPMLTLTEHGGAIISMRDWVGHEENLGCTFHKPMNEDLSNDHEDDDSSDILPELLIDKASLATNTVKIVSDKPPSASSMLDNEESSKYVRVGAFGYPLPDATLAIVNPDTKYLSGKMEVGEIWVDSHCISGGFWGLPQDTQTVFQAECYDYEGVLNLPFVRTGLLGFTYNGQVYVLGLYEDRINQVVNWYDQYLNLKYLKDGVTASGETISKENAIANLTQLTKENEFFVKNNLPSTNYRYHYSSHMVRTLVRNIPAISDCSIFNIKINKEPIPVAVIESASAVPAPLSTGSLAVNQRVLNEIATSAIRILLKIHNVRLYCVLITEPDTLPRTLRSGRLEIANMLCKRKFNEGKLSSVFCKFDFDHSLSSLTHGEDLYGGIWSPFSSKNRSDALSYADTQFSGLDLREESVDERTNSKLTDFDNILEILKIRAAKQSDELAFAAIEGNNYRENKQLSWKKFEQRVFAVCNYILEKKNVHAGDYVILMYSLSEDYIIALYACMLAGLTIIPIPPLDVNRIDEEIPSFLQIIRNYKVTAIFSNPECEQIMKSKPLSSRLKSAALQNRIVIPKIRNTAKHTKSVNTSTTMYPKMKKYRQLSKKKNQEAIIWLQWTPDHVMSAVKLSHSNVLAMCKILKETCQFNSSKPLIACVRHTAGLGFLQSSILGIFLGTSTYLVTPIDFAMNPSILFLSLSRYKVENTFITDKMIQHAASTIEPKRCNLEHLKNVMVGWDGRPDYNLIKNFKQIFALTDISTFALSNIYIHEYNPMISMRSYLSFDPVDLWLDPLALSQGYISLVNPNDSPNAIQIQDSGIVPVCTQIVIVNPETLELCRIGEYGEIWVCSEGNVSEPTRGPYGAADTFAMSKFNAKLKDWDPNMSYVRTGDLGFLHTVQRSISGNTKPVDLQLLYVLGKISDTFEVMGLHYCALDIEVTAERVADIIPGNTCAFRSGDYTVLVVEAARSSRLSSLVPLVVNAILRRFGLVIDIVTFVQKGLFPLSRLGEKQRSKILNQWLQGSLKTAASFGVNFGEKNSIKLLDLMNETSSQALSNTAAAAAAAKTNSKSHYNSESDQASSKLNNAFADTPNLPDDLKVT